jgi:Putative adhesin
MRYAALVAASAAVVAVLTLPRDGRSETAPVSPVARATGEAPVRRAGGQSTAEDFRWSGRLARGREIEVRGILSDVRAELTSGDQVEVVGRRIGRDADQVRIEVVESENGVVICAVYPTRRSERSNERRRDRDDPCENRGEVQLDDEARIDFIVRVPAGVHFAARTVDGDIDARGLRSNVDAASVSGNVRVATTGTARAATVSGDVDATFGATDGDDMDFASVSGDVVVRVANDVGAEVAANTLSGDIHSDFRLRIRGQGDDDDDRGFVNIQIGQQASGTIGRGGPELSVNTVSGDIRLLRAR